MFAVVILVHHKVQSIYATYLQVQFCGLIISFALHYLLHPEPLAPYSTIYCLLRPDLQFIVYCVLGHNLLFTVSWDTIYCLLCPGLQFIASCILGHSLLCSGPQFIVYCVLSCNLLFGVASWAAIYYLLLHPGPQFIVYCVLGCNLLFVASSLQFVVYFVLDCNLLFIVSYAAFYCLLCPGMQFFAYCFQSSNMYCLLCPKPLFSLSHIFFQMILSPHFITLKTQLIFYCGFGCN
jgi:hypothetical protein